MRNWYFCGVKREDLLKGLIQFGRLLNALGTHESWPGYECGVTETEFSDLKKMMVKEVQLNPWFTLENLHSAFNGIGFMLTETELTAFAAKYPEAENPKKVAIIMAGNVPFVGFHDVLCVLLSGNSVVCKFSSSDSRIPPVLLALLKQWVSGMDQRMEFSFGPLKEYDAVIATGSNNTIESLKGYFKHVPSLFRKNRTSIAILDGSETKEDIELLSDDCFRYFGMGCRNVGKLFVPADFNLDLIFEGFLKQGDVINHHKYANNYDYQRTIMMMNQIPFMDNNAFMLKEDEGLHAPLSMIYYKRYSNLSEVEAFIQEHETEIQIVVGKGYVPFGQAQCPGLTDYADNVDTMQWLQGL